MQRHIYVQRLQSPIQFSFRKIAEKPRCVARRSTIKELHYKTVHFFLGIRETEVELEAGSRPRPWPRWRRCWWPARWPLQRKLRRPRPTLPPPPAAAAAWPEQPSEMATERDGHWQPLIADNWQGGPSNSLFLWLLSLTKSRVSTYTNAISASWQLVVVCELLAIYSTYLPKSNFDLSRDHVKILQRTFAFSILVFGFFTLKSLSMALEEFTGL